MYFAVFSQKGGDFLNLLQDNPNALFVRYLIPSIGSALVVTIYSFVDTIAIGQGVGASGTAALAVVTPLFSIPIFIALIFGVGGSVLMSVARGGGNVEKGNACFTASLILVSVVGAAVWALLWMFRVPVLYLFGADDAILPYAKEYGYLLILCFPFMLFSTYLPSFLRNDGAPDRALVSVLAGAAVNIFGDWFFVFPLDMGMTGAALATSLGVVVQTVIQCTHFFSRCCRLRLVRPHRFGRAVCRILANGFGSAFLEIAMIVTTIVVNNLVMHYAGAAALSIYGVLLTISALVQHIYVGVGQAAQPICSMNFGAGKPARIAAVSRCALVTTAVLCVLFTASGLLFPTEIIRVFIRETPEILEIAPHIMRIYFLSLLFLGFNIHTILFLQSVAADRRAAVITVLRGLLLNLPLLVLLPLFLAADGIWWAVVLAEALASAVSAVFLCKTHRSIRAAG